MLRSVMMRSTPPSAIRSRASIPSDAAPGGNPRSRSVVDRIFRIVSESSTTKMTRGMTPYLSSLLVNEGPVVRQDPEGGGDVVQGLRVPQEEVPGGDQGPVAPIADH